LWFELIGFESTQFAETGSCEVSEVRERDARASHTVLPTLECIRMFLMTGEVCDELILVTRSDREVVVWEYSRGSCLYFLEREVAYFWELNVTLLGIQLALRGMNA
jgi:hypothetical protein